MRNLPLCGCIASTVILLAGPARTASFTKIADATTQSGDGSSLYTFDTPQLGGSTVVFIARSLAGLTALYAAPASGGPLVKLVDTNTKVPGGTGDFTVGRVDYFTPFHPSGCSPPAVGGKSAVFVGLDAAGDEGLYSVPLVGGKVVKIADYNTGIPGAPVPPNGYVSFNANYSFCHLAVSGTTVVFDAGTNSGVYSVQTNGHNLARVADANTPYQAPNPFPVVNGYGLPAIDGKHAAYIGTTTGGPYGVFYGGIAAPGSPIVSAASSEGNDYDQYGYPTLGGGTVLYAALKNGNENVVAIVNTAGTKGSQIFDDVTSAVPKGALGDVFNQLGTDATNFLGNDGTRKIFTAITNDAPPKAYATYDGVFTACSTKLSKLLQTGDAVGTQQVAATGGISLLQRAMVAGTVVDQFAAMLTLSAQGAPTVYNGSPAIYTVTIPAC
jgi:hypothetical protein